MDFKELLLNKDVVLTNSGVKLKIVEIREVKNIKELKIVFNNGEAYSLYVAVKNNAISFADKNIQKELIEEISNFDSKQAELAQQIEEVRRTAITEAKKRAEIEARERKQSGQGKGTDQYVRKDRKNVAYKATYCDGNGRWFGAPCSHACRSINCAKNGGRFCSTNSVCKAVIDGRANEKEVMDAFDSKLLCYESRMLLDYKIYAGRDDDGTVRGWSLDNDRLVILTTVKPGQLEEDRVIFGAFLINHSYDKNDEEASATSYPECRIALTQEEADEMKYWDYAPGEGADNLIQWKEGLLRYQTDEVCATVLKDLVRIIKKRGKPEQTQYAQNFLNIFLSKIKKKESDIPEKSGARI